MLIFLGKESSQFSQRVSTGSVIKPKLVSPVIRGDKSKRKAFLTINNFIEEILTSNKNLPDNLLHFN